MYICLAIHSQMPICKYTHRLKDDNMRSLARQSLMSICKVAKRFKDEKRSRSSCMFVWLDIARCLHVKL